MTGFLIAGGIVLTGAAAYAIYKYLQSKDTIESAKSSSIGQKTSLSSDNEVENVIVSKAAAVDAIKTRHEQAAETISDSLHTIFRDDKVLDIKTENSDSLDKIDTDLDELLK